MQDLKSIRNHSNNPHSMSGTLPRNSPSFPSDPFAKTVVKSRNTPFQIKTLKNSRYLVDPLAISKVAKSSEEQSDEFCDITRLLIQSKDLKETIEKLYASLEATMKQISVGVTADNQKQSLFQLKPDSEKLKLLEKEKKAKEKCLTNLINDKYKLMLRLKQVDENYEKSLEEEIKATNEKIFKLMKEVSDARGVAANKSKELCRVTSAPESSGSILKIQKYKEELPKLEGKVKKMKLKSAAIKEYDKELVKDLPKVEEEAKKLREEAKKLKIDLTPEGELEKRYGEAQKKKAELLKDKEDFEKTAKLWMTYLRKSITDGAEKRKEMVAKTEELDYELKKAQKKLKKEQELAKELEKARKEPTKLGMPEPPNKLTVKQVEYEKRMKAAREQTYKYRNFQSRFHGNDNLDPDTKSKHLLNGIMIFWNKVKRELADEEVIDSVWSKMKQEAFREEAVTSYLVDNFYKSMVAQCLKS